MTVTGAKQRIGSSRVRVKTLFSNNQQFATGRCGPCHVANLSSPRSGRTAVGLNTGCLSVTVGASVRGTQNRLRIGEGSLRHAANGLAAGRALAVLLVGGEVERDEEEEVGAEDTHAGESSELLTGAPAGIGKPRPVGGGEVGPRSEVDEACRVLAVHNKDQSGGTGYIPRSIMNWMIWRRVIHSFHQMRIPRALWK